MSAHCCEHDTPAPQPGIDLPRYRRVLWVALVVNAAMFAIEIIGGIQAGSLSLLRSDGGLMSSEKSEEHPVSLLMSGPRSSCRMRA